jgi:hypothetical protein
MHIKFAIRAVGRHLLGLVGEGALVVGAAGRVLPVELGRLQPQALRELPRVRACAAARVTRELPRGL